MRKFCLELELDLLFFDPKACFSNKNAAMASVSDHAAALDDHDDKPAAKGFDGATLQIGNESTAVPDVAFSGAGERGTATSAPTRNDGTVQGNEALSRDRPGSRIGRESVRSTGSRTALRPGAVQDVSARSYYCYKVGLDLIIIYITRCLFNI